MEKELKRKAFQGVWNVVRFNKHFYYIASLAVFLLCVLLCMTQGIWQQLFFVVLIVILSINFISLAVTYYVYDCSRLYQMDYVRGLGNKKKEVIVNINAGFDETSILLDHFFEPQKMHVLDFYDPIKHTEPSIKSARKLYPPPPATVKVSTNALGLADCVADKIFVIFSAHEIRNEQERHTFFKEMKRIMKPNGKIIMIEHLRDSWNFFAYNIGFLHFYSRKTWLKAIQSTELHLKESKKITPFVSMFIIENYGDSY